MRKAGVERGQVVRPVVAVATEVERPGPKPAQPVDSARCVPTSLRSDPHPAGYYSRMCSPAGIRRRSSQGDDPLGGRLVVEEVGRVLRRRQGAGMPLPGSLAQEMGDRFEADFSGVRLHTDPEAGQVSRQLQSQAFTYGDDVYFAVGAFSPHTAGGRHLLAHELAHVRQHRQGSDPGADQHLVGRASDRAEDEADTAAQKALSLPSSALSDAIAGPEAASHGPSGNPVIRRKVGFEFETGWLIEYLDPDTGEARRLAKKEKVGTQVHTGFSVEADDASAGKSEIEFVVYPPLAENDQGIAELEAIMASIFDYGTSMEKLAKSIGKAPKPVVQAPPEDHEMASREDLAVVRDDSESDASSGEDSGSDWEFEGERDELRFPLSLLTDLEADQPYWVTPEDSCEVMANPQVTAGLALDVIPQLGAVPDNEADQLPEGAVIFLQPAQDFAQVSVLAGVSEALKGLIVVIGNYLARGQLPKAAPGLSGESPEEVRYRLALDYPKQIADFMLARTDFGALFKLLPPAEQKSYQEPGAFLDLTLTAVRESGIIKTELAPDDRVIARGIRSPSPEDKYEVRTSGPTIREWLTQIPLGGDLIRDMEDSESMGRLGLEEGGVGPEGRSAGIFEIRALQGSPRYLEDWQSFAVQFLRYFIWLHKQG